MRVATQGPIGPPSAPSDPSSPAQGPVLDGLQHQRGTAARARGGCGRAGAAVQPAGSHRVLGLPQVGWTLHTGGSPAAALALARTRARADMACVCGLRLRRGLATDEAALHRFTNQLAAHGTAFEHIRRLADICELRLTPNPDAAAAAAAGAPAPWLCPVTQIPCAGRQPFVALRPCGHVLAERALTATAAADEDLPSTCPICSMVFQPGEEAGDVVPLCRGPDMVAQLRRQLQRQRAAKELLGGSKRKRASKAAQLAQGAQQGGGGGGEDGEGPGGSSHASKRLAA